MAKLLPVIHCDSISQTIENIEIVREAGCSGCFLIGHGLSPIEVIEIHGYAKIKYPRFWIGLNLLGAGVQDYKCLPFGLDALWLDNIHAGEHVFAIAIHEVLRKSTKGMLFGGTAFKYQPRVKSSSEEAALAVNYCDVVTTSGDSTGSPPTLEKIVSMREAVGPHPLAIASGITAENVEQFLPYVDYFLVATGINKNWNLLDLNKTYELNTIIKEYKND